ncbi:MAG: exodeoxyribonuclease III [Pseudomonadota bacterium]
MKIATFNINGIKARLPALLDWLAEAEPDIALLQEIKSIDAAFPRDEIEAAGYQVETHGQKGFNGVAILARHPIEDVSHGLPGDPDDAQARWIEATISGPTAAVRVCGLYLPNGNPAPGPKFDYKLAWMARMEAHVRSLLQNEEPLILAGDYNVIPEPRDAKNPENWLGDALYMPESRTAWRRLLNLGLHDATREVTQEDEVFSFWDYQRGAWEKNNGIRIDHLLISPQAADRLIGAGVDSAVRGRDKPSDHVPVWIELDL